MAFVLVATSSGCRSFTDDGEGEVELAGRHVCAVSSERGGTCLALVDAKEMWRRSIKGAWTHIATARIALQSVTSLAGIIFAGGQDEAALLCVPIGGEPHRLDGFDHMRGREHWFAGGPPLGVRSLTTTADQAALLAAVHVGGIARSVDAGATWSPTIPINFDVHEVATHPALPHVAAAAAAVGLCVSHDGGGSWVVFAKGLEVTNALAVAVLDDQVLFSLQEGPFAARSQVWRWWIKSERIEPVREGLPEWLQGKVDTGKIASGFGRAAIVDQGGNLWLSQSGSVNWKQIAAKLPYVFGAVILD
jgi:hypothetical protein